MGIKGIVNKKEFHQMVMTEINHLRDNATQEEKNLLNYDTFQYNKGKHCIYGQLTGSYTSARAKELYSKSLENLGDHNTRDDNYINDIIHIETGDCFTCLEYYLYLSVGTVPYIEKVEKHNEIIRFIKGEIHMLTL